MWIFQQLPNTRCKFPLNVHQHIQTSGANSDTKLSSETGSEAAERSSMEVLRVNHGREVGC